MSNDKDRRLVYSSDPELNKKCARCKELVVECTCEKDTPGPIPGFTAVLRIEKKGRGGKTVTVIAKLPRKEAFLKDLTTLLKKKCGSGGTYLMEGGEGSIEIQGDKRELIRQVLDAQKIKHKGGG
jgi:translation initiation factor 1